MTLRHFESYIDEHQAEGGWWGKLDTYSSRS